MLCGWLRPNDQKLCKRSFKLAMDNKCEVDKIFDVNLFCTKTVETGQRDERLSTSAAIFENIQKSLSYTAN